MRYAEKSFEIRFCAALSAAIMPFNRNPNWFGLTQAQERKAGIDAVLGLGGTLILFQFKAQTDSRIKIERDQLNKLTAVEAKYPKSTYYVFPEAEDIYAAARPDCMFTEAWCCKPSDLDKKISSKAKSASFAVNAKTSELLQARPKKTASISTACKKFGCFCPSTAYEHVEEIPGSRGLFFRLLVGSWVGHDRIDASFAARGIGIPIGKDLARHPIDHDEDADRNIITSAEMFEDLLGDGAYQNLGSGLRALFIAQ
ncbi:MAG: hypothetical protein ABJN75_22870 [Hoeflea sp.]|uniref:hypothetical protein n=1 Tax=Hoeflea sp. TaxID=1940281 RepID=UPI003297819E